MNAMKYGTVSCLTTAWQAQASCYSLQLAFQTLNAVHSLAEFAAKSGCTVVCLL